MQPQSLTNDLNESGSFCCTDHSFEQDECELSKVQCNELIEVGGTATNISIGDNNDNALYCDNISLPTKIEINNELIYNAAILKYYQIQNKVSDIALNSLLKMFKVWNPSKISLLLQLY